MSSHLSAFTVSPRNSDDPIRNDGEVVGTLGGFWRWACSDLTNNVMRGVLAEYLVAMALGVADTTRVEWDSVDLVTVEGWRVEVKSSAYLQSWPQSKLSDIEFSIAPAKGWDARTNSVSTELLRPSDVYVFCLLHHQDRQSLDPLQIGQWTFYVLSTRVLDAKHPNQKKIRLSRLEQLRPLKTDFTGLGEAVASWCRVSGETAGTDSRPVRRESVRPK